MWWKILTVFRYAIFMFTPRKTAVFRVRKHICSLSVFCHRGLLNLCADIVAIWSTVFTPMDALATIIFRSGKMQCLFEGGYCSGQLPFEDVFTHVDEVFCFRQHCAWAPCLQDSVDFVFGEIMTATYCVSCRHSQLFAPCLRTCSCCHHTLTIL